jgi:curli biogenesis system outer membrane secretion channel CsgG
MMIKLMMGCALAVAGLVATGSVHAQRGERITVAVDEFKNESGAGWWGGGVGWELSGMLSNELVATRAFSVVERSRLESVMEEQNLAASGRMRPGEGARIGQLTGAQYLVMGTVTSYEEDTASTGGGISFRGVSLGGKSSKAYVAVDLRVVNSETGEIEFVRTIEGEAKSGGMSIGLYRGGFGGALANENNTPAGKAIRAALVMATDYLECVMVKQDRCMREFDAADDRRRERTRGSLSVD